MIYEIMGEDRQMGTFESVLIEHSNQYNRAEFQDFVRRAKEEIESFINNDDELLNLLFKNDNTPYTHSYFFVKKIR